MTRQLLAFVVTSGVAALANFGSRVAFSVILPFSFAIVAAFVVGLSTAFVLNRRYVFVDGSGSALQQFIRFTVVNLFGLVQTLAISLLLANVLLPAAGWTWHPHEFAHAVGIATPIITSFFGHKYFSFRRSAVDS